MKKAHKKIIGFFALALVAAVTVFAALLPAPDTQATTSVVDRIVVRVVGEVPAISIQGITSGDTITSPVQTITIPYENVESLKADFKFTDIDGNEHNFTLLEAPVNYATGQAVININFLTGEYTYTYDYCDNEGNAFVANGPDPAELLPYYGYGDYILSATGEGYEGAAANSNISFAYEAVDADVTVDTGTGEVKVDLDYDDSTEGKPEEEQISKIEINIYDEDGNLVAGSPITVTPPTTDITIPFADYGLAPGTYTIEITAYNSTGGVVGRPIIRTFEYSLDPVAVPDTGGLLGNLNISKTDYLITGLLIFFLVGVSGAIFISKRDRKGTRRHK